jgi:hypothetical protein
MPELAVLFRRALFAACALLFCCAAGMLTAGPTDAAGPAGMSNLAEPDRPVGAASGSPPGEIGLRRIRFVVAARQVTADYQLSLTGIAQVRDQLRDGAHMAVEGGIRLFRHNLLRPDSEIAFQPLLWTLRHDPLTREFLITDAGAPEKRAAGRSPHLAALLREAWAHLHAALTPETPLENDETYIVRLDLVLKYAQVPPWLEKTLFFWSWELSPKFSHEYTFTWRED